jgi:hypothetical protein
MVLYGFESWTLTKTDEGKLSKLDKNILSKIYCPACVNRVWRVTYNDGLYILYKEPSVVKMINLWITEQKNYLLLRNRVHFVPIFFKLSSQHFFVKFRLTD